MALQPLVFGGVLRLFEPLKFANLPSHNWTSKNNSFHSGNIGNMKYDTKPQFHALWEKSCKITIITSILVGGWATPLKDMRKSNWIISPGIGVKIKDVWNHHLVLSLLTKLHQSSTITLRIPSWTLQWKGVHEPVWNAGVFGSLPSLGI